MWTLNRLWLCTYILVILMKVLFGQFLSNIAAVLEINSLFAQLVSCPVDVRVA